MRHTYFRCTSKGRGNKAEPGVLVTSRLPSTWRTRHNALCSCYHQSVWFDGRMTNCKLWLPLDTAQFPCMMESKSSCHTKMISEPTEFCTESCDFCWFRHIISTQSEIPKTQNTSHASRITFPQQSTTFPIKVSEHLTCSTALTC